MKHMKIESTLYIVVFFHFFSCNQPGSNVDNEMVHGPQRFETMTTAHTGVSFINKLMEDAQFNYMNFNYLYMSGAVGVGDFNQDGLEDLYFVATRGANKLFLNKGNFQFEDITTKAGVVIPDGIKTGVNIVDINNDGYPDIYQCRTGFAPEGRGNLLFINNKDLTFTEKSAEYGLNTPCASNAANFFDYDLDGDLDMYLLNHPVDFGSVANVRLKEVNGKPVRLVAPDPEDIYTSDRLYRNDKGHFNDVSKQAGIQKRAFGLSVTVADFNRDHFPDIFVANDYVEPDNLYINNKNGTFTDQINAYMRHSAHFSMGSDVADMNNDLLADLVVLDMAPDGNERQKMKASVMVNERYYGLVNYGYGHQVMRNMLQINNGNGSFSEIGCLAGVSNTEWSWSPLPADFDNNGWRDLYISNGIRREVTDLDYMNFTIDSVIKAGGDIENVLNYVDKIPAQEIHNYMFRNKGDLTFEDVSTAWGFGEKSFSNAAVYVDLDNDGDLDIVVNNATEESFIYRNKTKELNEGSHYLQIKLTGAPQNIGGIGAIVKIQTAAGEQIIDANPARGFLSTSTSILHFGLGTADQVQSLHIQWPDGKGQVLQNIAADQRITLKYQDAQKMPDIYADKTAVAPLFADVTQSSTLNFKHKDNEYFDFNRERLLPHKFSNQGPCIATGDVNGDGTDDFYIGGAFKATGALFLQDKKGHFTQQKATTFARDTVFEDTNALFFDADGDHDLDLYVVSGGNEMRTNSTNYQDRFYLNDGNGTFQEAPAGTIPQETESGSCVTGFDYDKDGDIDLFLGGRVIPGLYPKTPYSSIFKNNGGKFSLVTDQVAPEFAKIGMVTDLIFVDLDKDGLEEMVVAGEWSAIEVFKNSGGKYAKVTAQFGLNQVQGWWECLAAADLDGDGDQDLVAGNVGLNTRYRASANAPMHLYAKDFDGNGSIDPIMTWAENGKNYPVAFRDQIIKQLPGLKKKFVRYAPYSKATIEDVFAPNDLKSAQHLEANELQSCIFINNNGKFTAQPLPKMAQMAPVKSILLLDVDGNGSLDILLAGNDYGIEVETGRYDAGNGLVLLNDGKGQFAPITPRNSGFWATSEVRHLAPIQMANGKKGILIANNNDALQLMEMTSMGVHQ